MSNWLDFTFAWFKNHDKVKPPIRNGLDTQFAASGGLVALKMKPSVSFRVGTLIAHRQKCSLLRNQKLG